MTSSDDIGAPTIRAPDAPDTPHGGQHWEAERIPPRGTEVGRYVVLGVLGRGGMGVVLSAYDPELDRRVAVKLVRHARGRGAKSWPMARARLLREAQAMARLRHPNVITVYDAGQTDDGAVFVAMDLVEGADMRKWLADEPSREAVLDGFIAAGRGLAAAHAAGIVHRDFKPDNVLVGDDGTVVVTDFGLASAPEDAQSSASSLPDAASQSSPHVGLTATGDLLGTPAYMAPEQFKRAPTDPRTDVFAFCVALFEALAGARPFAGDEIPELVRSVCSGTIDPKAASAVPAWLLPILRKGLRPDPTERWSSMDELLAQLERDPGVRRRRTIVTVIALTTLTTAAAIASQREAVACPLPPEQIDAQWGADRRARVQTNFEHQQPGYGAATALRVISQLDGYATRWQAAAADACATTAKDASTGNLARLSCLESRLAAFAVVTDLMEEQTPEVVRQAPVVIDELRPVEDCATASVVERARPLPADAEGRRQLARAESLVLQAEVLVAAGRLDDAHQLLAELEEIARGTDDDHVRIDRLLVEAELLDVQSKHAAELEALLQALALTLRSSDSRAQAEVLNQLIHVEGYDLARTEAGHRWAALAQGAIEAVDAGSELEAQRLAGLAAVVMREGDAPRALELLLDAHQIGGQSMRPRMQESLLQNLAIAFAENGRRDQSITQFQELLALRIERYGESHPSVAKARSDLAFFHLKTGDYEQADREASAALDVLTRNGALGDDATTPLVTLALVDRHHGRFEATLRRIQQAHDLTVKVHADDHPRTAQLEAELARSLRDVGRLDEAMPLHTRELTTLEQRGSRTHLPAALISAAWTDLAAEALPRAHDRLQRALVLATKLQGEGSEQSIDALHGMGVVLFEMGQHREALEQLERALTHIGPDSNDPRLPELRALRARSLARDGEPDRANRGARGDHSDAGPRRRRPRRDGAVVARVDPARHGR